MKAVSRDGLAASIAQDGLLQNLVVTKGRGKQFRIISGERRFRALKLLAERGTIGGDFAVPVEVRGKLTKDDKLRLATIENVQREDLPPLDEAAAFAMLVRKGASLEDLAAKTGLSLTTIRRRLVLNDLCEEAKEALRNEELSLAQAQALTLGSVEQQQAIMEDVVRGYPGKAIRGRMHWRWLSDQRFAFAHQQFVYEEYKRRIHELEERCARLEQVLEDAVLDWPLAPVVTALQALRGIRFIAAVTLVAEIGDLHRFDSPKKTDGLAGPRAGRAFERNADEAR
ncbi:ParB/RepB/Spo0J family partition protein [Brucella intermedia]|uniref:ParB/RepB/Spo0J family partition protein n=1 Tax=Brucella intermedia TaxID=94625 RepID=UPI00224AA20A|nr:ParB/RepB/Spo0J family partition protein [Brucella intermedia]